MIYLLPQLVEEAAQRDPNRTAVVCRESRLTYGELDTRARSLAAVLVELGVKRGDRVGIYMNKSVESIVAVYGIMLAGAAYVPLDPRSPTARLRFVIEDCGIAHLISEDRKNSQLNALVESGAPIETVIGVSAPTAGARAISWSEIPEAAALPASGATEQDLCYVLYTSGSTGVPKGIMHTHRSALSWANVTADVYSITGSDIISNYAPLHFDLSTLDLFGGARGGATMVMIPEEHMALPSSLASLIEKESLTLFYTVPMALVQLGSSGALQGRDLSSLSRVLFGGEPMPLKHLRALMEQLPHTRFFNVYGPTEVNGVTHYEVPEPPAVDEESLPIGAPYPNVHARVVNEEDTELDPGQIGELAIRSPTMMRGYWGRPDLNRDAFIVEDRFSGMPEVFHKTGDLVRLRPDGQFEFHGRKDRQVKTRGYRVELDEVEAVLLRHPDVVEGAVFGVRDAEGAITIHAAAIARPTASEDLSTSLKDFLSSELPLYAVPASLTVRDDFPRTTSGKIDRRKLAYERSRDLNAGGGV